MNSRSLKIYILCIWLLAAVSPSPAQQRAANEKPQRDSWSNRTNPPHAEEVRGEAETILRENTSVVSLTATVTDKDNRLVTGLRPEHFEVFEDKVKQKIEFFTNDDLPLSMGIIFDVSGSMKGKLDRAQQALVAFVQTCHENDDFFLVAFNQRPELIAEIGDRETLTRELSSVIANGETALYDAIHMGLEKVGQGRHSKRALLVISDGEDNASRSTYRTLAKKLKEANVQIYCIGIVNLNQIFGDVFDWYGRDILSSIAQVTGGRAFFPRKEGELEDVVTHIAIELRHQYSIGYMPANQQRDGKWRKIKVRLIPPPGLPRLTVRNREGYYAAH